jgi:hypothetical protein
MVIFLGNVPEVVMCYHLGKLRRALYYY